MVHTLPDYTTKYKTAIVFGNLDHAELAARLGSIDIYDRRGAVIDLDNFEAPYMRWIGETLGGGGNVTLTTEKNLSSKNTYLLFYRLSEK